MYEFFTSSPLMEPYCQLEQPATFTYVDIGCSGGILQIFHTLKHKLRCLAVDASVGEVKRLQAANTNPNIQYIDAFVDLPQSHPAYAMFKDAPANWVHYDYNRISFLKTIAKRKENRPPDYYKDKIVDNQWRDTALSEKKLSLAEIFAMQNVSDVDMLKVDIDGPDFMVMQALDGKFGDYGLLAAVLEVHFTGSAAPTDHTFHNTDRFMRKNGFDLFGLNFCQLSGASLPFRFQHQNPGVTTGGRPLWGDALYIRDVCNTKGHSLPTLSTEKLISLVLIYSMFKLPDHAAEVLLVHREQLAKYIDVTEWLDILTRQSLQLQDVSPEFASCYAELIDKYDRDDPSFYGSLPVLAGGHASMSPMVSSQQEANQSQQREISRLQEENQRVRDCLALLQQKNTILRHYYRCKVLAKLTFGKKRKHYELKRDALHEKVRLVRGFCNGKPQGENG